jgi:signal transduction histidine kinase
VLVNGRHRGDIWLAWDMSERTELERQWLEAQRQLTEQNERLRRLDEAGNQFLAIVSHELRTPLTSIVSFSELIRGEADGLTPEGVKFLGCWVPRTATWRSRCGWTSSSRPRPR